MSRIMFTWGLVSAAFVFLGDMRWGPIAASIISDAATRNSRSMFCASCFGAAEAGIVPGVILYLLSGFLPTGGADGGPVHERNRGCQPDRLAIRAPYCNSPMGHSPCADGNGCLPARSCPSIVLGVLSYFLLPDGPRKARTLTDEERAVVIDGLARDEAAKLRSAPRHAAAAVFADARIWGYATVYFCGLVCFYAVNFWMPTIVQGMGIAAHDYLRVGLVSMIPWGAIRGANRLGAPFRPHR